MKKDLFIELAVEEIPSAMAVVIADSLSKGFENGLRELAVGFEKVSCLYTPRRFAVLVEGLEPRQKDMTVESFGPSEAAAFNDDGSPTAAALGFARGKGVDVKDLEIARRDKGRFLAFRQKIKGGDSGKIVAEKAPEIIAGVRCPKSMRWQREGIAFARPLRKLACFYGGKPLKLEMEGVPFSSSVEGHRFAGGKPFKPSGWKSYLEGLEKKFVVADPDKRRNIIEKGVRKEAAALGGEFRADDELLETVNGLVEHPLVLSGSFEKKFLELPEEVLTSVMKNHQKYFPVFAPGGGLLPHFIFVCGTPVKDPETVVNGNRRVLRARFVDAGFFHTEDLKTPLEKRVGDLDSTVFLSGLGSYGGKTARLEKIVSELAAQTGEKRMLKKLRRAAHLSKADLTTQMVFEIPELQGVMGRHYSAAAGEDTEVSLAIEEQYMPTARDSALPSTGAGALLAIADKIDNICSCFYLGMKPSGSSDPLALRRQAIGLIRITFEKGFDFSAKKLTDFVLKTLEKASYSSAPSVPVKQTSDEIMEFIAGRFRGIMVEDGAKPDSVEAAISAGFDGIANCRDRVLALEKCRGSKSFQSIVASFKRVVNIIKDSKERKVNPALFENAEEKALWQSLKEMESPRGADCEERLKLTATLGKPIDDFFDSTMVMHDDARVRKNRFALLGRVKDLFFEVGDLSKMEARKDG